MDHNEKLLFDFDADCFALAAKVRMPLILWKSSMLRAQQVGLLMQRKRPSCQAFRFCCGAGKIFASLRRFWAVAPDLSPQNFSNFV